MSIICAITSYISFFNGGVIRKRKIYSISLRSVWWLLFGYILLCESPPHWVGLTLVKIIVQ